MIKTGMAVCLLIFLCILGCNDGGSGGFTDTQAPIAAISFPPAISMTEGETVKVYGTASDSSAIKSIRVNGLAARTWNGYETWVVTVPLEMGMNTLTVETEDRASNSNPQAAEVDIRRGIYFRSLSDLTLDTANNRALVIDTDLDAVIAVDLTTGACTIFSDSSTPNYLNPFKLPRSITIDTANNRALVTDVSLNAVIAVDLTTGARSILSDNSTPDNSYPFSSPGDIAIDTDNNRALVTNFSYSLNAVIAVDLDTGARSILSDNSTPDNNYPFSSPGGIAIDAANNRALVTDTYLDAVIAVDLTTGTRSILSDYPYISPEGIAIDSINNRALVIEDSMDALIALDLTTGARSVLSGNNYPFRSPEGITMDPANNRALVIDSKFDAVIAVDLTTGTRSIISDNGTPDNDHSLSRPWGMAIDPANNRALVTDTDLDAVIAVDLSTGARTVLSDYSTRDIDYPYFQFDSPSDIAIDTVNNRALVTDVSLDAVIAVDFTTGVRAILSDNSTPDNNNPFSHPSGIAIDTANNRALVLEDYHTVVAVDLTNGARTVLFDNSMTGTSDLMGDIAVDTINNRALVTVLDTTFIDAPGIGNHHIIAMDLTTGATTVLPGDVPKFLNPGSIAIDTANNRALVMDSDWDALIAVNLTTGAHSIFSDNSSQDNSNAFRGGAAIAIDGVNNRVLALGTRAVIAIDMESRERVILSK